MTRTSYSDGDRDHRSASPTGIAGSCSSIPLSAKIEVPTNEQAATVTTRGDRGGAGVVPDPAGEVADDDQRERPAAGDVVGRRGEVDGQPAEEAEHGGELGAAHERGGDHDEQREVGHDAVEARAREDRDLEHHGEQQDGGEHERRGRRTSARPPWSEPSARITVRSLLAFRSTTTPTRSSEVKSTYGVMTACVDCWRGLL